MARTTDAELVRRVIEKDDRTAFSVLIERHQKTVFAILYKVLGNTRDVEDIAQEVFIAVYKSIKTFKREAKFTTWLYRIAYNHGCSAIRRLNTKKEKMMSNSIEKDDGTTMEFQTTETASPDDSILVQQVWKTVATLPPQMQIVLELFYSEEKSYQDISDILSIPVGTVKTQLFRARSELRMKIAETATVGSRK